MNYPPAMPYPAIGRPWGMNLWTPQTNKMGDGWVYQYQADKIVGFKQTHQPSPWMNDYGYFTIMPTVGKTGFKETERSSWYSHKAEIAQTALLSSLFGRLGCYHRNGAYTKSCLIPVHFSSDRSGEYCN